MRLTTELHLTKEQLTVCIVALEAMQSTLDTLTAVGVGLKGYSTAPRELAGILKEIRDSPDHWKTVQI